MAKFLWGCDGESHEANWGEQGLFEKEKSLLCWLWRYFDAPMEMSSYKIWDEEVRIKFLLRTPTEMLKETQMIEDSDKKRLDHNLTR